MPRLFAVFIISIAAVAQSRPAADLIITHAKELLTKPDFKP
jgi:hypothetical protein